MINNAECCIEIAGKAQRCFSYQRPLGGFSEPSLVTQWFEDCEWAQLSLIIN